MSRQAGQPHSRWHHLGNTATSVAAVVGIITGILTGLVGSALTALTTPVLAATATAVAVATCAGLLHGTWMTGSCVPGLLISRIAR